MAYTKQTDSLVTTNPAKFSLFLKTREIKQIGEALEHVLLLPKKEREDWIMENGEFMNNAFNDFIDDSSQAFETLSFDDEMVELSQDLVSTLQDTFNRVQNILSDNRSKLKN